MKGKFINRRANAILEYGIVLFIVISVGVGIQRYLRKHIHARVLAEARATGLVQGLSANPGPGQGLEWGSSATLSRSESSFKRQETPGGALEVRATSESSFVSGQAPPPSIKNWSVMEHKGEAIHIQDAPTSPPAPRYPRLLYIKYKKPAPPTAD